MSLLDTPDSGMIDKLSTDCPIEPQKKTPKKPKRAEGSNGLHHAKRHTFDPWNDLERKLEEDAKSILCSIPRLLT